MRLLSSREDIFDKKYYNICTPFQGSKNNSISEESSVKNDKLNCYQLFHSRKQINHKPGKSH